MWHQIFEQLKDFLKTLAGKLTAGFAFVVLALLILGVLGNYIPANYMPLVYIIVIGAMLIYAWQVIYPALIHRAQPQPIQGTRENKEVKPSFDSHDARESYLRAMFGDCQAVRLVGMDELAGDPKRGQLSLDTLYVSLDTTASVEVEEDKKRNQSRTRHLSGRKHAHYRLSKRWQHLPHGALSCLVCPGQENPPMSAI